MESIARPGLFPDPVPGGALSPPADPIERDGWSILAHPGSGWPQLAMGIWELRASSWGDCHQHDEVNYVLVGRLVVECDGETMEAGPGDVVLVPAGLPACYHAPEYARMLYVYGPNPDGRPSTTFACGDTTSTSGSGARSAAEGGEVA